MRIVDLDFKINSVSIILGFFDGIHCGHRKVIDQAVEFAKKNNTKTLLLTFKKSPAEYFNKEFNYICSRDLSYKKIEELGVDYLLEIEFEDVVNILADDYLEKLVQKYAPVSITTGFNHTFGANKKGNVELLEQMSEQLGYKYFCVLPYMFNNEIVSSTLIKEKIENGLAEKANELLGAEFTLKAKVIQGEKRGRKLGFPTANAEYPKNIVRLPFGVYKVAVLGKSAIMNWGVKPTFGGQKELLEVHILDGFNEDLYGKELDITVLKRIRGEKKFESKQELINQIKEDIKLCLGL